MKKLLAIPFLLATTAAYGQTPIPTGSGVTAQLGIRNVSGINTLGVYDVDASRTFLPIGPLTNSLLGLSRVPDLDSYKLTADTNDCAAFGRAITANTGGVVKLPNRAINVGSSCSLSITAPITFEGVGWGDRATTTGTVINITNTSSSLFSLSGTSTPGFTLRNIKFVQTQTTPSLGWSPTTYPAVVACSGAAGQITLENIQTAPVYDLVSATGCGRLNVRNIRGEVFHRVVTADQSYDSDRYNDWHIWPYWSSNFTTTQLAYVQAWTQANLVPLQLGRVDTAYLDNLFVISAKAAVQFSNLGSGVATRYHFGKIEADGSKYGILWDASAQATRGQIDQIDVEHTDQSATTLTGSHASITNSASLTFEGLSTNHRVQIGSLGSEWAANNVINDVGGSNTVDIGVSHIDRWGSRTGTDYAVYTSGSSQIMLGNVTTIYTTSPNYMDATKDSVCYTRFETGVFKRTCSNGSKPAFSTLAVQAATPTFAWLGTSQPSNQKNWDTLADSSGNLCTRAVNDAYGAAATAMCLQRGSGATVSSADFYAAATRFLNNGTFAAGAWLEVDNATAGYPTILARSAGTPPTSLSGLLIAGGPAGSPLPVSIRPDKTTAGWQTSASGDWLYEGTDGGKNIGATSSGRPGTVYAKTSTVAPVHYSSVAAPTASTCGTGPSVDAGSSAQAGKFSIGTGATACTLTFSVAYATNAYCTVTPAAQPAAVANIPYVSAQSKTAFTVSGGTASASYYYNCGGN